MISRDDRVSRSMRAKGSYVISPWETLASPPGEVHHRSVIVNTKVNDLLSIN